MTHARLSRRGLVGVLVEEVFWVEEVNEGASGERRPCSGMLAVEELM